ncbi:MAG: adenylate/guanylate cyclase domain-containing protein, partial [Burkholderiales bacterium]
MPNSNVDDLAVLFADVVESTGLYRRLGDIEALKIVSACLDVMQGVLPRHQGRLVKTLGDAVMCLFPDAGCAVDAAIEMQQAINSFRPGGVVIEIRIGLHVGSVVVGRDDVYGDTVNVAAYLADAATPGQVLIAEPTLDELEPAWRDNARPLFDAILKSTPARTSVYE